LRGKNPIAALFGRSPFGPLQEHMKRVQECAAEIVPLFQALGRGDMAAAAGHRDRIFELEHEADAIHEESLFLPVDRRDLLSLLSAQDSIADSAQDVASLVVLRGRPTPPALRETVDALVDSSIAATRACGELIGEVDELLESGFRGREAERVGEMIERVDALESDSDDRGLDLVEQIFAVADDLAPVDVMIWYELAHEIGEIADHAEAVADRLRLLIAN
jgi:predicted phosphate transport protein (TIGR00153 family)